MPRCDRRGISWGGGGGGGGGAEMWQRYSETEDMWSAAGDRGGTGSKPHTVFSVLCSSLFVATHGCTEVGCMFFSAINGSGPAYLS